MTEQELKAVFKWMLQGLEPHEKEEILQHMSIRMKSLIIYKKYNAEVGSDGEKLPKGLPLQRDCEMLYRIVSNPELQEGQ